MGDIFVQFSERIYEGISKGTRGSSSRGILGDFSNGGERAAGADLLKEVLNVIF